MKYGKQYSQEKTLNILFRDGDLDEDLDYIPLPKELVKQLQDYRNSYKDFMTKKARDFTELVFNELSIKGILIKLFDSDEYGLRSTGIEDIMLDSNIEFFPIYLYYYMVGSFDFTEEDMKDQDNIDCMYYMFADVLLDIYGEECFYDELFYQTF